MNDMLGYRSQLSKIGINGPGPTSTRDFHIRPQSLREAMQWMDSTQFDAVGIDDEEVDEGWTDETQGIAWTGSHWVFTTNDADLRRIVSFGIDSDFKDDQWVCSVPITQSLLGQGIALYHVGAPFYHEGRIYVDHFSKDGTSHALVFHVATNGIITFERWFELRRVDPNLRLNIVALHPKERTLYLVADDLPEKAMLWVHDLNGHFTGKTLALDPPIADEAYAQGGCVSPNGHLYIASGKSGLKCQDIHIFSLLNGRRVGRIGVDTNEAGAELEGICYADVTRKGRRAQIHGVVLLNHPVANDDFYLRSYLAHEPEFV